MFIKTTGFKKLIKEAYAVGRLRMGNDGEGIFLSGGYWVLWIKEGKLPKKELGAIIELTGELPERQQGFLATKDGNQYEIQENKLYHVMENAMRWVKELDVTDLTLHQGLYSARILQETGGGKIYLINDRFIDMISNVYIDENHGETPTEGPYLAEIPGVFWKNNVMAIHVLEREDVSHYEMLQHLEKIHIMGSLS